MGQVLKRPVKMYNIEARAQKAIEKAKTVPKSAPRYPSEAAIEARNKASIEAERAATKLHEKIPELEERLKHVYVESQGTNPTLTTSRKLPEDRRVVADPEYGYLEPLIVTPGKIPLRLAFDMIMAHKDKPQENTAPVLAEKFNLNVETTHQVLEHFKCFNVRLPNVKPIVDKTHPLLKRRVQKRLAAAKDLAEDGTRTGKMT